jgi:AcrR family transcriptional regulator
MGRPRLTDQRRAEILAALERCVLRDGLANTTVAAVAAEAGFHRTLVNHYFGDMESLVRALLDGLTEELTRSFRDATSGSAGLAGVMDYLFRRAPSRAETLIGALRAPGTDAANAPLASMYEAFTAGLDALLRAEIRSAPSNRRRATAFAIVCLAMSRFQLARLGVAKRHTQSLRSSAEQLIDALRRD